MNEYKKNVFIAALVIYGVETLRDTIWFANDYRGGYVRASISFDDAIADAEIFVTKILQRP